MAQDQSKRFYGSTERGFAASHPPRTEYPLVVGPTTGKEHNTLRVQPYPIACWQGRDALFAFDSSFVVMGIRKEMVLLRDAMVAHAVDAPGKKPGEDKKGLSKLPEDRIYPRISIFGHADPVGDDSYNKVLSGRRALAIYALLTRDPDIWDDLYSNGKKYIGVAKGDKWGTESLDAMKEAVGYDPGNRLDLFRKYMDVLCEDFTLDPKNHFLAGTGKPDFKGDVQGCSEFNPLLMFSQDQDREYQGAKNDPDIKKKRDKHNAPNRRVVIFLYAPHVTVDPKSWHCPSVKASISGCQERFWSNAETRRKCQDEERKYEEVKEDFDKNTFACRTYERQAYHSPCEAHTPECVSEGDYVPARILWPALGFPEVIAPNDPDTEISAEKGTDRIHLLLLTKKQDLHEFDVARHLRYVPWKDRATRYLPHNPEENSFCPKDIKVESIQLEAKDDLVYHVEFVSNGKFEEDKINSGRNQTDQKYIKAGLSKYIVDFYQKEGRDFEVDFHQKEGIGYKYLYEVQISNKASAKLEQQLYNLFWINEQKTDKSTDRSAEMDILLQKFAYYRPVDLTEPLTSPTTPTEMYEFEYYQFVEDFLELLRRDPTNMKSYIRTEVLHPLQVRDAPQKITIAQMADPHVATHLDIYEDNLNKAGKDTKDFNNWNKSFKELYERAQDSCDVVLLLGDLIDYGRGFKCGQAKLIDGKAYSLDYNWIQFYYFLVSKYQNPVYTVLGNHDYRIHPYGSLAPSHPEPTDFNLEKKEMTDFYTACDGAIGNLIWGGLEGPSKLAIITDIASVAWYLLLINPFLDYMFNFPGYCFLMLDWAKNEELFNNREGGLTILPLAKSSLSKSQRELVDSFLKSKDAASVLGLHATVVGPRQDWPREALCRGWFRFKRDYSSEEAPNILDPQTTFDGAGTPQISPTAILSPRNYYDKRRDPLYPYYLPILGANDPGVEKTQQPPRNEATRGPILFYRDWLIGELQKANVSLALSGHIHRNTVYIVLPNPGRLEGENVPKGTGVCLNPDRERSIGTSVLAEYNESPQYKPFFVNATSAGPIGYDCYIELNNPKAGQCRWLRPGYNRILLNRNGTVEEISPEWRDSLKLNEEGNPLPPRQS